MAYDHDLHSEIEGLKLHYERLQGIYPAPSRSVEINLAKKLGHPSACRRKKKKKKEKKIHDLDVDILTKK